MNDIIDSEDSSGEVPPKQCSSGVFTSVHLEEGYGDFDVDFITEQLVEIPKEKRCILISDTGVPINWDDQHWADGNTSLKTILSWEENNAGLHVELPHDADE